MSETISAEFPFEPHFIEVNGSRIHYLDVDGGEVTAVFLHGNPTSSYLWRNVIPHVVARARCIAPDLIGFGKSDKPDISYRIADHAEYVEQFLAKLELAKGARKVVLVLHDWGSALGLDWARRHEECVRGLVLMEFITRFPTWLDFPERGRDRFKAFRTPGTGRERIIERNEFVEQILGASIVRPLSEAEMKEYRAPFLQPQHREPTWRFPNELPIAGEPADVYAMATAYEQWLLGTDLPKLFFWGSPGALISEERAAWYARNLRNCKTIHVGAGRHFIQEDHPHLIGREIENWISRSFA